MRKRFVASLLILVMLSALPVAMATIDGVVSGQIQMNDRRTVGLNTSANLSVNAVPATTFVDGVGAGQCNILYQGSLALVSGAYSLDLNGAVLDSYGTAITAARLKGIYVKNTGTTALTVGAGSSTMTTWLNSTGTLTLPAGAWVCCATPDATGWVVTATTADTLNFTGTGTATFQVVILGGKT